MNPGKSYPAKLLLFGEYTILLGSSAIGMPVNAFEASLSFIDQQKGDLLIRAEQSNFLLKQLCDHYLERYSIFNEFIDLERFRNDITQGLYLSSTIPHRFGMGSSGALCAAIYGRYGNVESILPSELNKAQLNRLREKFIQMEAFFHGRSSGFDPLVSFLHKNILVNKEGEAIPVGSSPLINDDKLRILLIDSRLSREKKPYVQLFLDRFAPEGRLTPPAEIFVQLTNTCIDSFNSNYITEFWQNLLKLSAFQLSEMDHLIPEKLQSIWRDGLQTSIFALKLCGSGGGGYFTCITTDKIGTEAYFKSIEISVVEI